MPRFSASSSGTTRQRHYAAFLDMLRLQLTTRRKFEWLARTDPTTLTDLRRSARFLYLQTKAFGAKMAGRNFQVSPGRGEAFDVTRLGQRLEALRGRLARVVIECLDWQPFIRRYDRPETLFYLDLPYFGCEEDDGWELFKRTEFDILAALFKGLRGRLILSLNDQPEVRRIFAFRILIEADVTYSQKTQREGKHTAQALIITG